MKYSLFFLILGTLQAIASVSYSQTTKFTLDMKNATIAQVIAQIEHDSQFYFTYNTREINPERKVSVHLEEMDINAALKQMFAGESVNYIIVDKHVVLYKDNEITRKGSVQQGISVTGTVVNASNEPMPGVNVLVKGTLTGVVSDHNGRYSITVPNKEAVLLFSFVGYITEESPVDNQKVIDITLDEDTREIEEVVVVGYGIQKKGTITGSVSSISSKEISSVPVASTTNSLAGRLPGLISQQSSGQPGSDAAQLSIRGFGDALVIVDGIEAPFNYIDPNQIESISILKDGSASIYGARAGNGVILITTKRGKEQKPTITLNTNLTLQGITNSLKTSNAGQFAEMEREKWIQSGKPEATAPFTEEQIRKYYDGTDPQYPNTNWFDEVVRDWAPQQQYNLSVRGGSEKVKYYGFLGYLNQESIWKLNGGNYDRYNLQSNIDASITQNLTLQLDLSATFYETEFPWRPQSAGDNGTIWQDLWNTLPIYPVSLPDPTKISYANGAGLGGAHITSNLELIGSQKARSQNFRGSGVLNYKFGFIEGLSAKLFLNYNGDYYKMKNFTKPVKFYTYDYASDTYTLVGSSGNRGQLREEQSQGSTFTTQFSLNYDRVFANAHHFTVLALFEGISYNDEWLSAGRDEYISTAVEQLFAGSETTAINNGAASELGRVSYVGRLNYSYKNKYLVETSLRADASSKFPEDHHWGFFPSISLGWRITEEGFMENLSALNDLKIRMSYGESGNDLLRDPYGNLMGNYSYMSTYQYSGTYILGEPQKGVSVSGLPNPNLSWESIKIYNAGVNWSLWNKKMYGEADIFYRTRNGIPTTRLLSIPSTFGAALPPENLNSLNDRGFELLLGTVNTTGDFTYDISGNISWSRAKWDHYEEQEYTDPDEDRINRKSGRWTDDQYGYMTDKLFTSQTEINALEFDQDLQGNTTLRPGDIRYVDNNKDGKLDWRDQEKIGRGVVPHWMYGLNLNVTYKQFDLTALFQGAFGYNNYVMLVRSLLVYPKQVYDLRWSEKNNDANALVPRLGGSSINDQVSDYRYKSAGYLRLKSVSIGYNLPNSLLNKVNIQQARIYLSGTNLLTFDKMKKYGIDPEAPSGWTGCYYPQQRIIGIGLNVSF